MNQPKSRSKTWSSTRSSCIHLGAFKIHRGLESIRPKVQVSKAVEKEGMAFRPQICECEIHDTPSANARHIVPVVHTRANITRAVVILQQ